MCNVLVYFPCVLASESPLPLTWRLETHLVQVQLAANFSGWLTEETGEQVALSIEGKTLKALVDLQPAERAS